MFAKVSSLISHLREYYCSDAPSLSRVVPVQFCEGRIGGKVARSLVWTLQLRSGEEKGSECEVQENDCPVWLYDLLVVPPLPWMNDTQEHRMLWSPLVSRYIKVFTIPCPSLTSAVIPTNPAYSWD